MYNNLVDFLDRKDSKSIYRLLVIWAIVGLTPLAKWLPQVDGFRPFWTELTELKSDLASVKVDVAGVKGDVKILQASQDSLSNRFGVFEVDFSKYRKEPK